MTAANRIKTSDLKEGMKIRVVLTSTPPLGKLVMEPARNLRDSQEVVVYRCEYTPGFVPGAPYQLVVLRADGRLASGHFPGFQTHLRAKEAS